MINRPDYVTNEHLEYLDGLRESGVTNIFGARPYVQKEFGIDGKLAGQILSYWMASFAEENR